MPSASQKPGQKRAHTSYHPQDFETDVYLFMEAAPSFPALSPASSPKSGLKRKLEDEDKSDNLRRKTSRKNAEHQKHHTHFYLDGNILLQIGTTRFKVHRSRLTAESWWFQALFDHYNGTTPEENEVGKDIEDIVNEADTVGDDPLFFLDAEEGEDLVTANEFAALLTAIYNGIDYVFTPPTIDDIRLLFGAAVYYDVEKYIAFGDKFLDSFFPEFSKITKEPVLHNAVQAICMGDRFANSDAMAKILPRAWHDLARASTAELEACLCPPDSEGKGENKATAPAWAAMTVVPNSVSAGVNPSIQKADDHEMTEVDEQENEEGSDDDDADKDKDADIIKQISSTYYTRILVLQRRLSSSWDPIFSELMHITCSTTCGFALKPLLVFNAVTAVRFKYPCDPLLGMQDLRESPGFLANYCTHMRVTVNAILTARRALICEYLSMYGDHGN